ncbi:MAG: hypothetical protein GY711_23960 [bacterium]|nr:hypothetical protein [bacterium]
MQSRGDGTMQPGKQFERDAFEWIRDAVADGLLGVDPASAEVHAGHELWSRDRESFIEFDVVIAVSRRGAEEPFFYWIWECKDLGRAVHVGAVEEFHGKLEGVGKDRVKGTIFTTSPLQTGTLQVARAHGIGVMRVVPREDATASQRRPDPDLGPLVGRFDRGRDVHAQEELFGSGRSDFDLGKLAELASSFLGAASGPREDERPLPDTVELLTGSSSPRRCFAAQSGRGKVATAYSFEQVFRMAASELRELLG